MSSVKVDCYTQPHHFEPLLPQRRLEEFRQRTRAVVEQSLRLSSSAHPATVVRLRELVREMNSYYSNRIEGQSTHPLHIERALHQDFSDKPDVARLQRLSSGLWSMNRGLAHNREKYYPLLDAADSHRQGDLDGRGNLSEKRLGDWCDWFIAVAEDPPSRATVCTQVDLENSSPFMSRRDGIPWGKGEVGRGMGDGGTIALRSPIPTPALPLKGRENYRS